MIRSSGPIILYLLVLSLGSLKAEETVAQVEAKLAKAREEHRQAIDAVYEDVAKLIDAKDAAERKLADPNLAKLKLFKAEKIALEQKSELPKWLDYKIKERLIKARTPLIAALTAMKKAYVGVNEDEKASVIDKELADVRAGLKDTRPVGESTKTTAEPVTDNKPNTPETSKKTGDAEVVKKSIPTDWKKAFAPGSYTCKYGVPLIATTELRADGTFFRARDGLNEKSVRETTGKIEYKNGQIILKSNAEDYYVETWSIEKNGLISIKHFHPGRTYPDGQPQTIGQAKLIKP